MARTAWTSVFLLGAAVGAAQATLSCNALLGNPTPGDETGSGGFGGDGPSATGGLGGRDGAGGGSSGSGGGGGGSGGGAPLPSGSIGVSVTGLDGAVTLEADGEARVFTEDGEHELELDVEVGQLVTVELTNQPPGQRCLVDGKQESSRQYTGKTLLFAIVCRNDVTTLASLTLDVDDLGFSSNKTDYALDLPFVNHRVTLTPVLSDPTATLKLDGDEIEDGEPITLSLPTSLITLVFEVESAAGSTRSYRVQLERDDEFAFVDTVASTDPELDPEGGPIELYGHAVVADGDRFAVLGAGIVNTTDAAVYIYDFDSLALERKFDSLQPLDYHAPHLDFSAGHVLFVNADFQSMSLWSSGEWNAGPTWLPFQTDPINTSGGDRAAGSVSGNTLAIGGFSLQRVYTYDGEAWNLEDEFAPFPEEGNPYGDPLYHELSGDTLVVGGRLTSGTEGFTIFERTDGSWSEALPVTGSITGIALGDGVLAVGFDEPSAHTKIYERTGGTWAYARQLTTSGRPLAIYGPFVILGGGATATLRLWTTTDYTDSHTLTRSDTTSTSACSNFAYSSALNENGLVLCDRCSECSIFR